MALAYNAGMDYYTLHAFVDHHLPGPVSKAVFVLLAMCSVFYWVIIRAYVSEVRRNRHRRQLGELRLWAREADNVMTSTREVTQRTSKELYQIISDVKDINKRIDIGFRHGPKADLEDDGWVYAGNIFNRPVYRHRESKEVWVANRPAQAPKIAMEVKPADYTPPDLAGQDEDDTLNPETPDDETPLV